MLKKDLIKNFLLMNKILIFFLKNIEILVYKSIVNKSNSANFYIYNSINLTIVY